MTESQKKKYKILDFLAVIYFVYFITINILNISRLDQLTFNSFMTELLFFKPFGLNDNVIFSGLLWMIVSFSRLLCTVYLIYRLIMIIILRKRKRVGKIDYNYVRDCLRVPPATLSFIINMDLNSKRDIVAELLSLELDGYLKRENNKFFKTEKYISNLPNSDKYLIQSLDNINAEQYKEYLIEELKQNNYIEDTKDRLPSLFVITIVIFLTCFFAINFFNNSIMVPILFGVIFISTFGLIFYANVVGNIKYNYKRTYKFKELLRKALGLKAFLKEFTNINDSKLDELHIKDSYLIYSIIFDMNNDLVNEIEISIH